MKLWHKILIGMVLGVIFGLVGGDWAIKIKPLGTMFINLIKMLIVPLIFTSLAVGVMSMGNDLKKMGIIGAKTLSIYLVTTAVAVSIGLLFGTLLSPGTGVDISTATTVEAKAFQGPIETLVNLVTTNPVASLAEGNVLQIIVFSILFGIAISMTGEKGKPLAKLFESTAEVIYKLTYMVMQVAPIGVFALMAWVVGKYGLDLLMPLIKVILAAYIASILHMVFIILGSVKLLTGLSPFKFLKGVMEPLTFAFASTSSSGTLPLSMTAAEKNLGVSRKISSFVLPLGATINMNGTAIYEGVTALFVAQAYGIDLTINQYFIIIFTSTLASIGTAGVPGAGLIMLSLVLSSVGLPLEGIAIVAGIDRILDMARTTLNVGGDLMATLVVGKSEKEFNKEIFDKESALK
jgi:Na+/H+-dicarboxylate symporter